jgi:hypothetical protein
MLSEAGGPEAWRLRSVPPISPETVSTRGARGVSHGRLNESVRSLQFWMRSMPDSLMKTAPGGSRGRPSERRRLQSREFAEHAFEAST